MPAAPPDAIRTELRTWSRARVAEEYERFVVEAYGRRLPGIGFRSRVARRLPAALRTRARFAATALLAPVERRRARRRASTGEPLHLHLGAGLQRLEGFVNVDLFGLPVDLRWNVAKVPLPFDDASVDSIFHEHMLEHLAPADAAALNQDCYRMLRPGGVLRFGVPDARRYLEAYAGDDPSYLGEMRPDIPPVPLFAVNSLAYGENHRLLIDAEVVYLLLRHAGFTDDAIRFCEWRQSLYLDDPPDAAHRSGDTLYVEARKPSGPAPD